MSDLQLSLIALGAVIVIGVVVFNWWQERRLLRETAERFGDPVQDPLSEEFRIEPDPAVAEAADEKFYIEEASLPPAEAVDEVEREAPPVEPASPETVAAATPMAPEPASAEPAPPPPAAAEPVPAAPPLLPARMDERVDLIALLQFGAPQTAETLQLTIQQLPLFDKPVQYAALAADGQWRMLDASASPEPCTQMACALQLADRAGPVAQPVVESFQGAAAALAAHFGATLEWLGATDPAAYARSLDEFCESVDVLVGLHIVQRDHGPFAGTKLRGLAEASGLTLMDDGAFHFRATTGDTLFTLISQDRRPFKPESLRTIFYRGISFQLDVPRAPGCVEAFDQMAALARDMEAALAGQLVDDNQRPLAAGDIAKIRQQLVAIQARMAEHDIVSGSFTALRLFS